VPQPSEVPAGTQVAIKRGFASDNSFDRLPEPLLERIRQTHHPVEDAHIYRKNTLISDHSGSSRKIGPQMNANKT